MSRPRDGEGQGSQNVLHSRSAWLSPFKMPLARFSGVAEQFRFRRHANVGSAAAEQDEEFLRDCFVDTGDLETLLAQRDQHRLLLGRTGTGKTALLKQLSRMDNVIRIEPESLSFNYVQNSSVLQFFVAAGVKLDLFFRLLWRHVFTVELLKSRYGIRDEGDRSRFLNLLKEKLTRDKAKERALDYLLKWGSQFWRETEYRIQEITKKVEGELASMRQKIRLLRRVHSPSPGSAA